MIHSPKSGARRVEGKTEGRHKSCFVSLVVGGGGGWLYYACTQFCGYRCKSNTLIIDCPDRGKDEIYLQRDIYLFIFYILLMRGGRGGREFRILYTDALGVSIHLYREYLNQVYLHLLPILLPDLYVGRNACGGFLWAGHLLIGASSHHS
tara:strand:+ start:142 stop:591 length:450 start_codon:yes stop_codon:yes gene_type:complete